MVRILLVMAMPSCSKSTLPRVLFISFISYKVFLKNIKPTTFDFASCDCEYMVDEYEIYNALNAIKDPVSMYEPIYNDGGDTIYLFDQVADTTNNNDLDLRLAVDKAIKNLSERSL